MNLSSDTPLREASPRFPEHLAQGRAGTSFKSQHLTAILEEPLSRGLFEVHAENYMGAGGAPHRALERLRTDYAISIHGVCMSLGGAEPLDRPHLDRFRTLVARYEPALVSEHLAWSAAGGIYFNDLLPLPYTEHTLARTVSHINQLQEHIGRRVLIENPSIYLRFTQSTLAESDFLAQLCARTGCGLLLDINNLLVSSINCGFSARRALADFPLDRVEQIHLAGRTLQVNEDTGESLAIDTHAGPVAEDTWSLFEWVIGCTGPLATVVEWDSELPPWGTLRAEANRARRIMQKRANAPAEDCAHAYA